jgi:hypothetical protein
LAYLPVGFVSASASSGIVTLSGHTINLDHFRGSGYWKGARALFDFEPWLTLLAVTGLVLFAARWRSTLRSIDGAKKRDALVVAAWCVPYALVCGLYNNSFERFFLPLVPMLAIAAAYGCAVITHTLVHRLARPAIAAAAVFALAMTPQALAAGRLAQAWSREGTLELCADWIRHNVPPGSARIALFHTIDLPLLRTAESLHANALRFFQSWRPWMRHQARLESDEHADERYDLVTVPGGAPGEASRFARDAAGSMKGWQARYVVVELGRPGMYPNCAQLVEVLRTTATCVARFSPYRDDTLEAPFVFEQVPQVQGWWTGRLWKACGFGPVVEVYRLH